MEAQIKDISSVIYTLLKTEAVKAVKYVTPKLVVRAVRKRYSYNGGKFNPRVIEISLTIGKPNYVEREAISDCVKAGEPFPVKKIRVKLNNPKRAKLKPHGK